MATLYTITSGTNTVSYAATSDAAWNSWVDGSASSSATYSTTTSNSSDGAWVQWVSIDGGNPSISRYHPVTPPPETEEQRQARLEREQRQQEEMRQREEGRIAAQRKAEELLRENLDDEQREQFDKTKWFFVIGQSGKRYRIRHGWAGNVDELNEEGHRIAEYCIHPAKQVPTEDNMLIQKLMLEADEARFLQIANRSSRTPVAV
jgi:hypothetical protein